MTSGSVQANASPQPVTGIAALEHAATIRVTEKSYITNREHRLAPNLTLNVTFARPNRYLIDTVPLGPDAPPQAKHDSLVTNGREVTEYVGASNQYMARTVSNAPRFRLSKILALDYYGKYQFLPDGFQSLFTPVPGVKSSVTQTRTRMNGQSAKLISIQVTPPANARVTYTNTRLWLSPSTGLPIRYEDYIVRNGKEHVFNRIDYSN